MSNSSTANPEPGSERLNVSQNTDTCDNGFGKRLRKLRKDADITQKQLAEYLGLVTSAIGKYELYPGAYPSVEILLKISEYFSVSTDYLLKGSEPNASIENNINGTLSHSPFIQANNGGIVVQGEQMNISVEAAELLRIYETLGGRERIRLLNFALESERSMK